MIKYKRVKISDWIFLIILVTGALIMSAPFIWLFSSSLRPFSEAVTLPPKWLPPLQLDVSAYQRLVSTPFFKFLRNSLIISTIVTASLLMNAALAGYSFARLRFPGREKIFFAMLIPIMIPIQVILVPLFLLMTRLNLVNSHWSLVLPAFLGAFGPGIPGIFGIFMLRQHFKALPRELEEAAKIDGAGYWVTFLKIILPTAKAPLTALGLIIFVMSWNDYFLPFVFLNTTEKMLLPVGILAIRQPLGTGDSLELAAVTLSILPLLILFIFGQKRITEGFVGTGLKG